LSVSKKVLVTGGAGFIGSHLCKKLIEDGNDVLCVDNYFTGTKGISTVKTIDLEEAIKKGWLCEYYYHISFVDLTADEYEEYRILTHQMMKYIFSKNPKDLCNIVHELPENEFLGPGMVALPTPSVTVSVIL